MASPFRVFRKYQKTLLVVAGVVLMFVFVIGDSLFSYMSSKDRPAGEERNAGSVAVHWDGGRLTNAQVGDLVYRRRILNSFLEAVEREGMRSAYMAGVEPTPLRVQPLRGDATERNVVRTRLFADAARKAGMNVSDDTAVQYLDELGRGNVSRDAMRAILKNMSGGGRASIDYVIDALREEMLARNYEFSHYFAWETVTPQQRWKDWLRVNDRVVIEAAAVPAESFLAEVKDPSDVELAAFFETFKDVEPGPDLAVMRAYNVEMPSPNPGFRIPRKIDLQFIQANYDDFLAKAEAKITDEEIAKYYEDNKKLFEKADTGLMEDAAKKKEGQKADTPATKADGKVDAKQGETKDAEKKSGEPDTKKAAEPAATEPKSAPAPGAGTDPKSPPSPEKKSEDEPPADDRKAEEKKSSSRNNPSKNVFRLTAFQEDGTKTKDSEADTADATPDAKSETATDRPAATSNAKADTAADKPAEKTAESPDAKAAAPADTPAATSPALGSPGAPASTTPPADTKPVEYQPLSEVKDLIRKQLAEGKVAEQLGQLTKQIQEDLDREYNAWRFSDAAVSTGNLPDPPKALVDLAPIAEKNGLKVVRTGPKSLFEIRDLPIGKSSVIDSGQAFLMLLVGGSELNLYEPKTTVDIDGNRYVVMKMSDTPGKVPTLAEVKNEVLRAWKNRKASELAQKHAAELAKKAQEEKKPLKEVFADDKNVKVVQTDPFAELTAGDVGQLRQQSYRLSQPEGIVAPGPGFINRVFELKDGEVAAILNNDQSIAYVVRLVEHQPALPQLRTAYLAEAESWPGQFNMTQGHIQEVGSNLHNDIIGGVNLQWDRPPDSTPQDEPRDEE